MHVYVPLCNVHVYVCVTCMCTPSVMCMCVWVSVCHMNVSTCKGRQGALCPLELELQVLVYHVGAGN